MSVDRLIPAVLPFVTLLGTHQLGCFASTYGYDAELGRLPNIVGHFAATLLGFTTLAVFGFCEWVIHEVEGAGEMDHLSGESASGLLITQLMIGFQAYEISACCWTRGEERRILRGPHGIMLLHHATVIALAMFVAYNEYMLYYTHFFFGVPEISSVLLAFVDLFKAFPKLKQRHQTLNDAIRGLFAAAFLGVRGIWFTRVTLDFWHDTLVGAKLLEGEYHTPHPAHLVLAIGLGNLILLAMQYFWATLILRAVVRATQSPSRCEVKMK